MTLFNAIGYQNILLVMGLAIVFGVISLAARLLLDILYALLDPRVRSQSFIVRSY